MSIARIHQFLTGPVTKPNSPRLVFWFSLTLTFAAIYGILSLKAAFSSEYVVQDDARMYVFWMQRFVDPDLLPNDLNADYHQSISPPGYTALYQFMARLGIQPLLLSKLLPIVLGAIATVYSFGLCWQILPVPTAAFISTLMMNQSWWLKDDIVSATPRGFIYPLFLAFLYYLLRGSWLPVLVAIALLGLFYPPIMFISIGILILRLWRWEGGHKGREAQEHDTGSTDAQINNHLLIRASAFKFPVVRSLSPLVLCIAGLTVAGIVMLPYALSSSEFGPTVTAAEARTWPEFSADGRIAFFYDNPWKYWFQGIHTSLRLSLNPPLVGAGLLLPLLFLYPSRFPLVKQVTGNVKILVQLLLASLGLFFAAHALIFKLFLPSRYTAHSLLILMAITGGMALTIILDAALHACKQTRRRWQQVLTWGAIALVATTTIFYPNIFWKDFAKTGYFLGREPALYKFFQQQPKDSLIASLAEETFFISTFSHRPILVSRKLAIPYHVGYYRQIRQRVSDSIRAQYSPNLAEVRSFNQKYGVDFWLVQRSAFAPSYLDSNWFKMFQPAQSEAIANLKSSNPPVLAQLMQRCSVFETGDLVVLQAKCIQSKELKRTED